MGSYQVGGRSGQGFLPSLLLSGLMLGGSAAESHIALTTPPANVITPTVLAAYHRLPLSFEANRGQTEEPVRFLSHSPGYGLFFTPTEVLLVMKASHPVQMRFKFVGANPHTRVTGLEELPGKVHYFLSNDPSQWHRDIPTYGKVQYAGVYPGIDLVFYGNQQQLECDFVVAPGADPARITLGFEGVDKLEVDAQGDLSVSMGTESLRVSKPVIYQENKSSRQVITGAYVLRSNKQVGFQIGAYDVHRPLIVDPVLSSSTYLGGNNLDSGNAIAVDASGNIYVAGDTTSTNFPVVRPRQSTLTGFNAAFIAKLNPTASALIYSTYLDGNRFDIATGIALDASGNAYVTGYTGSENFPTVAAVQPVYGGGKSDAFVAKLDSTGSTLLYATFLGGDDSFFAQYAEAGAAIAVDPTGQAYVTGYTSAANFPAVNALQSVTRGPADAFVTKLSSSGTALMYATRLGGSAADQGNAIAIDTVGNAYVTGVTFSTDFPTANPFQSARGTGIANAFVAKLNPAGSGLLYATYLGGNRYDHGSAIAVDSAGNAYVTGVTHSTDFPTITPLQAGLGGASDAFVTKLNAAGSAPLYSTYLGGATGHEEGLGLAIDHTGHAYVTGFTNSTDFPTANPLTDSLSPSSAFASVPFITKLNPPGTSLIYSSFLGGNEIWGSGHAIATDASGNAYLTGVTSSANFPIANALQDALTGFGDAFVAKLAPETGTRPITLTVILAGKAGGVVTSTPSAISCGSTCHASLMSGERVTLTAVPASGSAFAGWSGGGCRGTETCVVTVATNMRVTATFAPALTVAEVWPSLLPQGVAHQRLTILGTNFPPAATAKVSGTGVTVKEVSVVNAIQLNVAVSVDDSAMTGHRDVTVSSPGTGVSAMGAGLVMIVSPQEYLDHLAQHLSDLQVSGAIREAGVADSLVASLNNLKQVIGVNNAAAKKMLFAMMNKVNDYAMGRQIGPVVVATVRTGLLPLLASLP